jgi:uncharacterized protein (TIGR02246 family)
MTHVTRPEEMNETFAEAVNARDLDRLLSLYEPTAVLRTDGESCYHGLDEIRVALRNLLDALGADGRLDGRNAYCLVHGDVALLRADYVAKRHDGAPIMRGSSAEIVHRGADGAWRYIVDHATGSSLPPLDV